MNNIGKILLLSFILLLGCKKKGSGIFFIFKNNTTELVTKYKIYEKPQGDVYVSIENKKAFEKIKSVPIQSVFIKRDDTIVQGKPIMSAFSRQIDFKPFMYYVNSQTNCLDIYELNGRNVFFIGLKEDLLPLYNKKIIRPINW